MIYGSQYFASSIESWQVSFNININFNLICKSWCIWKLSLEFSSDLDTILGSRRVDYFEDLKQDQLCIYNFFLSGQHKHLSRSFFFVKNHQGEKSVDHKTAESSSNWKSPLKPQKEAKYDFLQLFLVKAWRKQNPVKIEKLIFFLRLFIYKIDLRKKSAGPNPKMRIFFILSYIFYISVRTSILDTNIDIFILIWGGAAAPLPPLGCSPMLTVFAKECLGVWWSNISIKSFIFWT